MSWIQPYLLLASVIAGLLWARRGIAGGAGRFECCLRGLVPAGVLLALLTIIEAQGRDMNWDWNGARLAPLFALFKGYNLYYPADHGPVLNTIYTPISTLAFMPAALGPTPASAMFIGLALAQAFYYLPAWALLLHGAGGGRSGLAASTAACGVFGCMTALHPMLARCAASIHTDAPAMGLMMLSVLALIRPGASTPRLAAAAFLASASFWTKQTAIPVMAALPLSLALLDGFRPALRLAAFEALFTVLFGAWFCLVFGAGEMYFNAVTLPSHHSWAMNMPEFLGNWAETGQTVRRLQALRDGLAGFLFSHVLWLLAPSAGLFAAFASDAGWRPALARLRGPVLMLSIGLFMIPTGVLGWIKIGGNLNNLGFVILPLVLALLMLLQAAADDAHAPLRQAGRMGFALAAALVIGCRASHFILPHPAPGMWDWKSCAQIAYEHDRFRPGEIYFPKNPLGALMANGRLYMFDYGVQDRILGQAPVSHEHFMRHVPPNLKYIAFSTPGATPVIMDHFPDFELIGSPPGLEKFFVYARKAPCAMPNRSPAAGKRP